MQLKNASEEGQNQSISISRQSANWNLKSYIANVADDLSTYLNHIDDDHDDRFDRESSWDDENSV